MEDRPDISHENYRDGEISLLDIYDFLRDGCRTLVGVSFLGLIVGVIASFVLPAKYQASALIDSGQVGFVDMDQGVSSRPIEKLDVLSEKMKVPSFYSDQTITKCVLRDTPNPRQSLVSDLLPNVARNSNFVSVSYESESVEAAKTCLESVLEDVVLSQKPKMEAISNYSKTEITNTRAQLDQARQSIEKQQTSQAESLALVRKQLLSARQALQVPEHDSGESNSVTEAMSAVQAMNKRSEVQELETMLMRMQADFTSNFDQIYQVNRLNNRLTMLQQAGEPPNTREAELAVPVFASEDKVLPRRSVIILVSLLIGGFLGLMIQIVRRAIQAIRAHEAERKLTLS